MAAMDPNNDTTNSSARGQSTLLFYRDHPMFIRLFEDMSRRCVRGVLQELSLSINLPPQPLPDPSIQARYRLQFINKVKNTTFTTDLVRDENENPIKVAIYDMYGQPIISPDCFLSSAKVRITVLDAEFWKNKGVNWSRSEFNQSMLREREGKGPILIGDSLIIRLENGVGTFENIVFNDNSRWTKSGFGLGVMVEGEGEEGYLNGERVQEGVSESFRVKDRRGKASQKPDWLKLTHKVHSLKKVGKDRASLLQQKKIKTVEDFLKLYYNDESALREILCIKSESDKGWKSMVNHAMQCADKFQAKYSDLNNSNQPRQALVHMPGRTVPLQINGGPRLVGSGSSVPNPCENNLLIPACE
ncbi:calmodulin-binding protein 60 B-like isoform X2 [Carex rostrata]